MTASRYRNSSCQSPQIRNKNYGGLDSVLRTLKENYNFPLPSEWTREPPYIDKLRALMKSNPQGITDALKSFEDMLGQPGERLSGKDGTPKLMAKFDEILVSESLSDRDISVLQVIDETQSQQPGRSSSNSSSGHRNRRGRSFLPASIEDGNDEEIVTDTDSDTDSFHSCPSTPPPLNHAPPNPALDSSLSSFSSSPLPSSPSSSLTPDPGPPTNKSPIQAFQKPCRTEIAHPVPRPFLKTHFRSPGLGGRAGGHRPQLLQQTPGTTSRTQSFHTSHGLVRNVDIYTPLESLDPFDNTLASSSSANMAKSQSPRLFMSARRPDNDRSMRDGGTGIDDSEASFQKMRHELNGFKDKFYPDLDVSTNKNVEGDGEAATASVTQPLKGAKARGEGANCIGDENDEDYGDIDVDEAKKIPALTPAKYPLQKHHFAVQYEATRVALNRNHPPDSTVISVYLNQYCDDLYSAEGYRDKWKILARFDPGAKNLGRTSETIWTRLHSGNGWPDNVYLTGSIQQESVDGKPLKITLNPLQRTRGNRFFNRFGSDRFLTLRLPSFQGSKVRSEARLTRFTDWLVDEELNLLNRTWKAFYMKDCKNTKKGEKEKFFKQVIFFAEKGVGIGKDLSEEELNALGFSNGERKLRHEMRAEELLGWHIPLQMSRDEKVSKIWSRISLGFSDGTPTVTVKPSMIEFVRDFKSPSEEVMDDGCSIISPALMQMVRQKLGSDLTPTAIQARIGGAKGIWMVDPDGDWGSEELYIKITDSQLKYKGFDNDEDWARLTLDVLASSHDPTPATINIQLIPILADRGVPFSVMKELLEEHLEGDLSELLQIIDDPVYLRKWLYDRGSLASERIGSKTMATLGALPANMLETAILLLESGFSARDCDFLKSRVRSLMNQHLKELKEKLHIRIPHSTRLFCVADPTHSLKEGEVSLRFSNGILDPKTMRRRTVILGDILVARNPAHLPSDVQKVKAVDILHYHSPKLRDLQDVIVFSVKGNRSLASLLSGGDYDGDKPWICWDERVVKHFTNGVGASDEYYKSIRDNDFEKSAQTMAELEPHRPGFFNRFLRIGISNSLQENFLGICTSAWEKECYQSNDISHPKAIRLAVMCSLLVDAPKQGLSIRDSTRDKIIKDSKNLRFPAYKDLKNQKDGLETSKNVIDQLHYVAGQKVMKMQTALHDALGTGNHEPALTEIYNKVEKMASGEVGGSLTKTMKYLRGELQVLKGSWANLIGSSEDSGFDKAMVSSFYSKFREIMPPEDLLKDPVINYLVLNADSHLSNWSLLRASLAYHAWSRSSFVWYMAGRELCFIKSQVMGRKSEFGTRTMIEEMYMPLKTIWGYRQIKNTGQGVEDEQDNL